MTFGEYPCQEWTRLKKANIGQGMLVRLACLVLLRLYLRLLGVAVARIFSAPPLLITRKTQLSRVESGENNEKEYIKMLGS